MDYTKATDLYSALRKGQVILRPHETPLISGARRLAKADGLQVVQSRQRRATRQSRYSARQRPTYVALVRPTDPTTIYAPDASKEA